MIIALLGSIPKGDDIREGWIDWKIEYKKAILEQLPNATFVDGDAISDSAGSEMVVGHDLLMIKQSDVCVVDAHSKIGAGTAQEIIIAKYFKKPVVTVIPKDTHHRRSNVVFHGEAIEEWIHPFLFVSSDYVAESPHDAAKWIKNINNLSKIKDLGVFDDLVEKYKKYTQAK